MKTTNNQTPAKALTADIAFLSQSFRATSMGGLFGSMLDSDVEHLAKREGDVLIVQDAIADAVELVADRLVGSDAVTLEEQNKAASVLYLMASLTRFCADASDSVSEAKKFCQKECGHV